MDLVPRYMPVTHPFPREGQALASMLQSALEQGRDYVEMETEEEHRSLVDYFFFQAWRVTSKTTKRVRITLR
jgi:hypothetical protein